MRKFNGQDYLKLYQKYAREDNKFVDTTFTPTDSSIYLPGYTAKSDDRIVWVRATDMIHNGRLFTQCGVSDNVIQGAFGGWTVSAARLLALHPQFFKRVVPAAERTSRTLIENSYAGECNHPGIFRFRFFKFGSWVEVVVDDFLPCTAQGEWVCSLSGDRRELWVPLIEKAFAKLNGCYQLLKSLKPSTSVFVDFTGNVPEELQLLAFSKDASSEDSTQLFHAMRSLLRGGALLSCFFHISNPMGSPCTGDLCNDMYAVTKVSQICVRTGLFQRTPVKVVQLCKPFLDQSPLASYADPNWASMLIKERERLNLCVKKDGQFTILFSEFLRVFSTLLICRAFDQPIPTLTSMHIHSFRHFGKWSRADNSVGGSFRYTETVCQNPQYLITLRRRGEMVFYLQRRHVNHPAHTGKTVIGFTILKVEENRNFRILNVEHRQWYASHYTTHREVFGRCVLDRGRYILLPTTDRPGHEGDFLLRAYTLATGTHFRPLMRNSPPPKPMDVLTTQLLQPTILSGGTPNTFRIEIITCNSVCTINPLLSTESAIASLDSGASFTHTSITTASRIVTASGSSKPTSKASLVLNSLLVSSSSYFIVRFSEESALQPHTTQRLQASQEQVVLNSFIFCVRNPSTATVSIELWNNFGLFMDKFIGATTVSVSDFALSAMVGVTSEIHRELAGRTEFDIPNWAVALRIKYDGLPLL
ncbi:hypothetical protein BASA61_008696 [Batrachochytrium salamandrivorans]|nr:hypothetical protein BASA61_008696 [Batrachochytrium salamandrivorans]